MPQHHEQHRLSSKQTLAIKKQQAIITTSR
jgi:hypothetical protein